MCGQAMGEPPLKWCNTCRFLRPPRTHHCRVCDICVVRFDHHCVWLNTCPPKRSQPGIPAVFARTGLYREQP